MVPRPLEQHVDEEGGDRLYLPYTGVAGPHECVGGDTCPAADPRGWGALP